MRFKLEFEQHKSVDGFPIIELKLDICIDTAYAQQIEDKIVFFIEQGINCFIINFANVRGGSIGLGLLINLIDKLNKEGKKVKLSFVSEKMIALFEMLKLTDFFCIVDTTADALQGFFYE